MHGTINVKYCITMGRAKLLLLSDEEHRVVDLCHTLTTVACDQQLD